MSDLRTVSAWSASLRTPPATNRARATKRSSGRPPSGLGCASSGKRRQTPGSSRRQRKENAKPRRRLAAFASSIGLSGVKETTPLRQAAIAAGKLVPKTTPAKEHPSLVMMTANGFSPMPLQDSQAINARAEHGSAARRWSGVVRKRKLAPIAATPEPSPGVGYYGLEEVITAAAASLVPTAAPLEFGCSLAPAPAAVSQPPKGVVFHIPGDPVPPDARKRASQQAIRNRIATPAPNLKARARMPASPPTSKVVVAKAEEDTEVEAAEPPVSPFLVAIWVAFFMTSVALAGMVCYTAWTPAGSVRSQLPTWQAPTLIHIPPEVVEAPTVPDAAPQVCSPGTMCCSSAVVEYVNTWFTAPAQRPPVTVHEELMAAWAVACVCFAALAIVAGFAGGRAGTEAEAEAEAEAEVETEEVTSPALASPASPSPVPAPASPLSPAPANVLATPVPEPQQAASPVAITRTARRRRVRFNASTPVRAEDKSGSYTAMHISHMVGEPIEATPVRRSRRLRKPNMDAAQQLNLFVDTADIEIVTGHNV